MALSQFPVNPNSKALNVRGDYERFDVLWLFDYPDRIVISAMSKAGTRAAAISLTWEDAEQLEKWLRVKLAAAPTTNHNNYNGRVRPTPITGPAKPSTDITKP